MNGGDKRRGRRPGDPAVTSAAILDAARTRFARDGFTKATIRRIAAEADVDPALVLHYFGTKQGLFLAAQEITLDPSALLDELLAAPVAERGERLLRAFLPVIDAPASPVIGLIRAAASEAQAATMLREFIESMLLPAADDLAPGPNAPLRITLAMTQVIGVAFGRHVVAVGPLGAATGEDIVALAAPAIQRYFDPA
ncbi:MAG: TetR family transcriptional regulator [Acidimicrobiales bacterium]